MKTFKWCGTWLQLLSFLLTLVLWLSLDVWGADAGGSAAFWFSLPTEAIQPGPSGAVSTWWSWLIQLNSLAVILCVTVWQTCWCMDKCHFCSPYSVLFCDSCSLFWWPGNSMQMTEAWGGSLYSSVYVCYSSDMQACGLKQWAGTLSQQLSKPECTH